MVGGDDHDGVVPLAESVQPVEEDAELVVDLGDHAVVGGAQLVLVHPVRRRRDDAERRGHERVQLGFGRGIGATDRGGHLRRIEHVVVRSRHHVRGVRAQVRQVRAPRVAGGSATAGVELAPEPLERSAGQERGLGVFGVVARGCPRCPSAGGHGDLDVVVDGEVLRGGRHVEALVGEPRQPRGDEVVEVHTQVEAAHRLLPLAQLRGPRRQGHRVVGGVGVAEQGRSVSEGSQRPGQGGEVVRERSAVVGHPVVHLPQPGQQRRPTRRARRAVGEVVGEADALAGQAVERRSAHQRVATHAQAVGPELVEGDEEDVRAHRRKLSTVTPGGGARVR